MDDMRLRNQKIDLFGRSMILNVGSIVLNLIGVYFVVAGYHASAGENSTLFISLGSILIVATLSTLVMLKGLFLFSYVTRAIVGGLFIVSGLIKANDPWGFAFKLEEYFEPTALSYDFPFFEWFTPYVLELSILICVAEIIIGVAVIVGGKIKLTSWLLMVMLIFFAWLTWYTTSCNEAQIAALDAGEEFVRQCVTDCGCFGDALRGSVGRSLTPAESFWKDLVLIYLSLIIFINQWKIKLNTVRENWVMVPASIVVVIFFSWVFGWIFPIFFTIFTILGAFVVGNLNIGKIGKPWKMAIFTGLISLIFSVYTSMYLPVKDYRPYRIGNNILDEMNKGVPSVSSWVFQYKDLTSEEIVEVPDSEWTEEYSNTEKYEYVDRIEKVIQEGVDAPITDFLASINYEDLSEEEKQIPVIDSMIQMDLVNYYDEYMVVKSQWGTDTISSLEYDPEFYPDSIYTVVGDKFTQLLDPSVPYVLDLTSYLLSAEDMFLMTIRDIKSVSKSHVEDFKAVYEGALENGIPFYVISPATREEIAKFKEENDFNPTFLMFDGIEVKIIVRSNPGLVLLNKGTVIDKWPCRSVPDYEDIHEDYLK